MKKVPSLNPELKRRTETWNFKKLKLGDKSIDNIGFWKRKDGIFREKAGFIGNIMQRACTISDKFKFF